MNNKFWMDRWAENRIGFHNAGIQPLLEQYWPRVAGDSTARVLVPLCGKSHDLEWLRTRGHEVVGVELSGIAARSFADEHGLEFREVAVPPFTRMQGTGIEIYVGDFFDATPEHVGRFGLVYDRAALIALPEERRLGYADKLKDLLEPDGRMLLITIEWDLAKDQGPPFGVDEVEVGQLFDGLDIVRLDTRDCLDEEPRFRDRGATRMQEVVYAVRAGCGPATSA